MADPPLSARDTVRSMVLPTRIAEKPQWESFTDPQTGCAYLYNPRTGASKWAGSAADQVRMRLHEAPARPPPREEAEPLALESVEPVVKLSDVMRDDDVDDADALVDTRAEAAAEARAWKARGMLRTAPGRAGFLGRAAPGARRGMRPPPARVGGHGRPRRAPTPSRRSGGSPGWR